MNFHPPSFLILNQLITLFHSLHFFNPTLFQTTFFYNYIRLFATMKLTGLALVALAATSEASPLNTKQLINSKREDNIWEDKDRLCKRSTRTPEDAAATWEETGAGVDLELFIKTQWGKFASFPWRKTTNAFQNIKTPGSRTWRAVSKAEASLENHRPLAAVLSRVLALRSTTCRAMSNLTSLVLRHSEGPHTGFSRLLRGLATSSLVSRTN